MLYMYLQCIVSSSSSVEHDFSVGNVYSNLLPHEQPDQYHVSWEDLVPKNCTSALFTSLFPERTFEWIHKMSPSLQNVLIIADRCPKPVPYVLPSLERKDNGWLILAGSRTGGIVHCSKKC